MTSTLHNGDALAHRPECVDQLNHFGGTRCKCSEPFFDHDEDGHGEPTIWLVRGTGDPLPMPVLSLTDLQPDVRHLWPTVVRAMLVANPGDAVLNNGEPPSRGDVG